MIKVTEIQDRLLPLIGWEQNYDTSELRIASHLTKSESGMFYQQAHPLLTLQNLASIAPDFSNMSYPVYDEQTPYRKGDIVDYQGVFYKALQDSVGYQPDSEPFHWTDTSPFSEWLERKTKGSIQKAILRFCNEKMAEGTYKVLCENKTLFDSTARIADQVRNRSNLVGFEIVPIRAKGIVTQINKIGLQFTEPGKYTLYFMHSSSSKPIRTIEVTKVKSNSMEWFAFDDLFLPYESAQTDAGGSWYLCYNQNELPGDSKAIRKDRDWSKAPCSSCSRKDSMAWQAWSKYLEIHPFYVNSEFIEKEGQEIPEPEIPEPEIPEPEIPEPEIPVDPLHPVNVTISDVGATKVVLEWNAVDGAVGYNIYTSPNMPSNVLGIISTSHIFEGLEPDTDYYFDVSAVYPYGESNASRVYVRTKIVDEVPEPEMPEPEDKPAIRMWDVERNQYTYDCNYGINLEVTVACDITDFIIEQRRIFVDIILKQVAVDMLREFVYNANVRTNRHSINVSKMDVLYELDGDSSSLKKSGLSYQLDLAMKAVKLDTSGMSRICLGCKNNGLKFKTI